MFSLSISCFVKLDICCLAEELYILLIMSATCVIRLPATHQCLLLPNHDWCSEVQVDDDQQLVIARLEEEMLDVTEEDVC